MGAFASEFWNTQMAAIRGHGSVPRLQVAEEVVAILISLFISSSSIFAVDNNTGYNFRSCKWDYRGGNPSVGKI